jgi:ATP-binding cassette, subfamily B, bacterial PglK
MLKVYRQLYDILDRRERRLTLAVFAMMVFVALFEAVGVASIMPFMAVMANPEIVETNVYLAGIYDRLSFPSTDAFLFFLGMVFLVLIVGSLAFRAFAFWVQVRFAQKRNHAWSCRLVSRYLNRPYDWFLNQHSGDLGASILDETLRVVDGALYPAMQLISQGLVAVVLFSLLLAVDPMLAVSMAIVLGGAYAGFYLTVRRYIGRAGQDIRTANRKRFKLTGEMFGGIKDVKVGGLESTFLDRFRAPSLLFARRQIAIRTLSALPPFAMQALIFGGIMVVMLYFLASKGNLQTALPVFSLYALAGYRLMPALQAIYHHLSQIRANVAILDGVHEYLCEPLCDSRDTVDAPMQSSSHTVVGLQDRLQLIDVSYRYPGADRDALQGINLEIPAYATVGLVGPTGSGKTTLVDVILGLLAPERGMLVADGLPITPDLRRSWRRTIGYVPQQIFLADDTISGNIAFGIPAGEIDQTAVECAARIANLHDFIATELRDGYATLIGERGVRLSGGQRQRIGIARALYRDPDVLILDEATSALDNLTEQAVMEAVHNLSHRKTIILIAHRLTTVRECDHIFYLEQGRIMAKGTYEELLVASPRFRLLAGAAS